MADTSTTSTLQENDKRVVVSAVVESDGTGSTTLLVDVSGLSAHTATAASCTYVQLVRLWFACDTGDGFDSYGRIDQEDSDGDIPILGLTGTGYWDFREFGGIKPNTSSNSNQYDVNLVVPSTAQDGNMYTVVAEFLKHY